MLKRRYESGRPKKLPEDNMSKTAILREVLLGNATNFRKKTGSFRNAKRLCQEGLLKVSGTMVDDLGRERTVFKSVGQPA